MTEDWSSSTSSSLRSVTDGSWLASHETDDTSTWLMSDITTFDSTELRLQHLKTLHHETLNNWTGSFNDPAYDYLNNPPVKVVV